MVVPSSGETRNVDMRLNRLQLTKGERVLFRQPMSGWQSGTIIGTSEFAVLIDGYPQPVYFAEVAGVIPPGIDAAELIGDLKAAEFFGDNAISAARKAKRDSLRKLLDRKLGRANLFVPGQA